MNRFYILFNSLYFSSWIFILLLPDLFSKKSNSYFLLTTTTTYHQPKFCTFIHNRSSAKYLAGGGWWWLVMAGCGSGGEWWHFFLKSRYIYIYIFIDGFQVTSHVYIGRKTTRVLESKNPQHYLEARSLWWFSKDLDRILKTNFDMLFGTYIGLLYQNFYKIEQRHLGMCMKTRKIKTLKAVYIRFCCEKRVLRIKWF